ncbi:Endopolyphosphatase [Phlyctochytrium planicorne]|nr:Endopolyphosphatase [Phlyctochytrium planicorne]
MLHVTDIHVDPSYIQNGDPGQQCHRANTTNLDQNISGRFGTLVSNCDSPLVLLDATFEFMKKETSDVDFIIYTGDTVHHDRDPLSPRTEEEVLSDHKRVVDYFGNAFDLKKVKVFPTMGNNDAFIHNTLEPGSNTVLRNLTRLWAPYKLDLEDDQDFQLGGYYHRVIKDSLSVISLNSFWLYNLNPNATDCTAPSSPGKIMLDWLETKLEQAEKAGGLVHVIGHVPPIGPGNERLYFDGCHKRFLEIVVRYRQHVGHLFHGHTNFDMLSVVVKGGEGFDCRVVNGTVLPEIGGEIVMAFTNAPSIVPFNNPAIRVYSYETGRGTGRGMGLGRKLPFGTLLDYVQHYTDLGEDNVKGRVRYRKEYSARKIYGVQDLSWKSMLTIAKGLYEPGSKTLGKYLEFFDVKLGWFGKRRMPGRRR